MLCTPKGCGAKCSLPVITFVSWNNGWKEGLMDKFVMKQL